MAKGFRGRCQPVPEAVRREMRGVSWHPDPRCPPFEALELVELSYLDFAGGHREGELVVAVGLGGAVIEAFRRLYQAGFPIARMERVELHGGDDDRSMAANNCSAFNFRTIAGTDVLSRHATGHAIDLIPVQYPYLIGDRIEPPAAAAYLDRSDVRPGMIVRPGPVVDAFAAIGWEWGGDWSSRKDYHHFAVPR
jgi:poly-gamma-glutamate synthesis protein (capsule biosynthesis protein)